jgi:hypothetical protein
VRPRRRLRAALTCTPEWRSEGERADAARAAARAGEPALAAALARKDASALRKRHFFWLCAHWRYASAVWARRGPGVGVCAAAAHDATPSSGALAALLTLSPAVPRLLSGADGERLPATLATALRDSLATCAHHPTIARAARCCCCHDQGRRTKTLVLN